MRKRTQISFVDIFCSVGPWRMKAFKLFDHCVGASVAFALSMTVPQRNIEKTEIRKILVIRPGGLGDAVFLLPILWECKRQGADINILCEKRNAQVFISQQGLCACVWRYDVAKELFCAFRECYDAVIDTEQWHFLSALTAFFIKAPLKVGFATRTLRSRLFGAPIPYDQDYELKNFQRLFTAVFAALSEKVLDLKGSFFVRSTEKKWADTVLAARNTVVIALGASIAQRQLKLDQWQKVVERSLAEGKTPVLIGTADVKDVADSLGQIFPERLFDFVTKTDLVQAAALIQKSDAFIGVDSGMLHVAAAVGASTVSFFGPGNKEKWAPQGMQHRVVSSSLACSPCTLFGYTIPACGNKIFCIKDIV